MAKTLTSKRAIADQYAGDDCTLNGEPARILGRLLPFARIRSDSQEVEYAWETVALVMTTSRAFRS